MAKKGELSLARGKVKTSRTLNYLVVRDERTQTEKTVAYNLSYEMEKFLQDNFMNQNVEIILNVRRVGNEN
jgi:hypothetical protein